MYFLSVDRDVRRGGDPEPDLVAAETHHCDDHVAC
jgi:hypothetical protein